MAFTLAGLGAIGFYLAGTLVQIRALTTERPPSKRLLVALAALGAVLHAVANLQVAFTGATINLGLATSASLVSWIMLVFVLLASLRLPVLDLLVLVLPLAIVGTLALLVQPAAAHAPVASLDDPLIWHILISLVAYTILFMAACQSVLLAVMEHRLRTHQTIRLLRLLPPLQTMESLLFELLWAGVITLTLAIVTGFVFLEDLFAQRVAHHTVLTIASWIVFAVLLAGHHLLGWRGTTAVRWTLIGFTLLLLGYFGSKFVLEVLL